MKHIIALLCAFCIEDAFASQVWRTGVACGSPMGGVYDAFDCKVVADNPVDLCVNSLIKTNEFYITYILVRSPWVKCGYVHYWNRQGVILWGKNHGDLQCPEGKVIDSDTGRCISEENDIENCQIGNPINIIYGNKIQSERDYSIASFGHELDVEKYYNSASVTEGSGSSIALKSWMFKFEDNLIYIPVYTNDHLPENLVKSYLMNLSNGRQVMFKENGEGKFIAVNSSSFEELEPIIEANETVGWRTKNILSGDMYIFDGRGLLVEFIYSDGIGAHISHEVYNTISNISVNEKFIYRYERNWKGQVISVFLSEGIEFQYEYDAYGNLIKVINPDLTEKIYHYEDPNYPQALTGITDERAVRYATWEYDASGNAVLSQHAVSQETYNVDYTYFNDENDPRVTFTNSLGRNKTIHFGYFSGRKKPVLIESHPSVNAPGYFVSLTYDANGFLLSKTDGNGNITTYSRDNLGRELNRTEADGAVVERIISTDWDAATGLPSTISRTYSDEIYTYDSDGRVLTRTVASGGLSRTWTYSYNAIGLVQTLDGPRTGVADITAYIYDSEGNVATVTNPLGHTVTYNSYHFSGLPTEIIDENGVITRLVYDSRGRLTSSTLVHSSGNATLDLTTIYAYNGVGLITQVTEPNGGFVSYEYDDARNLVAMENELGERWEYIHDSEGNVIQESILDNQGTLVRTLSRTYDELSRLKRLTEGAGQENEFAYDANSNITSRTDGHQSIYSHGYDALDRLVSVLDPLLGETRVGYDHQDRVTSVEDARGLETQYFYNGLGDLTQLNSPDAGVADIAYDGAGNPASVTDARGVNVQYTYDALNRVTNISYPNSPSSNISYLYDDTVGGNYGIGRLTQVDDGSGTTSFIYDYLGNLIQKNVMIAGQSYTTQYGYNSEGVVNQVIYPSGRIVEYVLDSQNRITGISTQVQSGATSETVISNVEYLPYGPVTSYDYGNGVHRQLTYDQDYRLVSLFSSGVQVLQNWEYIYDANNNIVEISDPVQTLLDQIFGYDLLDRLISADGTFGQIGYQYDSAGNRLHKSTTQGSSSTYESYSYAPTSSRLTDLSIDEGGSVSSVSYSYDQSGNLTSRSPGMASDAFTYDDTGRLVSVNTANGTVIYLYNAFGQRIEKSNGSSGERFHYNEAGQLIAVSDLPGNALQEFIYLNSEVVAVIVTDNQAQPASNVNYYVLNDHLPSPKMLLDENQTIVWLVENQTPFGKIVINEDYDQDGEDIAFNFRFPGQYFDQETAANYNYFRNYDPSLGRYLQSDPIGLAGGLNSYLYVEGNPLIYSDPFGLTPGCTTTFDCQCKTPTKIAQANCRAAGGIPLPPEEMISEQKVSDQAEQLNSEHANDESKTVPWPDRSKGQWTAICKVVDQSPDDCVTASGNKVGFGWGVGPDMLTARLQAEKMAKEVLGSSNVHHPSCKCTGPQNQHVPNCGR